MQAVGVTKSDLSQCSFLDENMRPADCRIEQDLHRLARQLVTPQDVVLEVGQAGQKHI